MHGAIPQLPQYAFMAWCSVKAQGPLYLLPYWRGTFWKSKILIPVLLCVRVKIMTFYVHLKLGLSEKIPALRNLSRMFNTNLQVPPGAMFITDSKLEEVNSV
jgi:hypothetical protein